MPSRGLRILGGSVPAVSRWDKRERVILSRMRRLSERAPLAWSVADRRR